VWEHHADHDRDDNGNHNGDIYADDNGDHYGHNVRSYCHTNSNTKFCTIS
jgi:hypothetical protein